MSGDRSRTAKRLPSGQKVPHMGWNSVEFVAPHPLLEGIPNPSYFYFVTATTPAGGGIHGGWDDGIRGKVLQHACEGERGGDPVPPGEERALGLRIYENFVGLAAGG